MASKRTASQTSRLRPHGLWRRTAVGCGHEPVRSRVLAYALGLLIGIAGACGKLHGSALTRGHARRLHDAGARRAGTGPDPAALSMPAPATLNQLLESQGFEAVAINGFAAAVLVLGFVQGAYSTEVLRAAIQAIPRGQIEAARAFGMSPWLAFRRITLPAMLPFAIPGLANLWLIVTKDTALIAVVGYTRTDARHPPGGRQHQGLFHLLHRRRASSISPSRSSRSAASPCWRSACAVASGAGMRPRCWPSMIAKSLAVLVLALLAGGRCSTGCLAASRWDWMPKYLPLLLKGLWLTLLLWVLSCVLGMSLPCPSASCRSRDRAGLAPSRGASARSSAARRCSCSSG